MSAREQFQAWKSNPAGVTEKMGMDLAMSVRDSNIDLYTEILLWTFNERASYRPPKPKQRPIELRDGVMTIETRDLPGGMFRTKEGYPRPNEFFVLMPVVNRFVGEIHAGGHRIGSEIYWSMQVTDELGQWQDPGEWDNAKAWGRQGILVRGPLAGREIRWKMTFGGDWESANTADIPPPEHSDR